MAIVPLVKINIVSLKKYEEKILDWLADEGIAQVVERRKGEEENEGGESTEAGSATIDYELAGIDFALRYLGPYKLVEKKTLWEKLAPEKIRMSRKKVGELVKKFDYRVLTETVQNIESEINQTKNELLKLTNEREQILPWQNFGLAQRETETETTKTVLATTALTNIEVFREALGEKVKESETRILEEDEKSVYLTVCFKKKREKEVEEIFSKYKVEPRELPEPEMEPGKALVKLDGEIKNGGQKLKDLEKKTRGLARDYKNLQIVFDFLSWEKEKQEAREKFLKTEETFSIDVWLKEREWKRVTRQLSKITKNEVISQKLPAPEKLEEVPVIIENRPLITPFESVTGIYGMPKTNELDPTPFLAPFFILFFAICLSDAGYGVILAVVSWLAIKVMRVPREKQKLFRVLIYGGLVTFIVGALFGGWFGIQLDELSDGWVKTWFLKMRMVDPIKDPIAIMLLAFALGILHILSGIGVRMYRQFKEKNYLAGILDSGLWILFIISLLVWVLNGQVIKSAGLGVVAKWVMFIFMGGLILTQGRSKKNPLLKLGSGVLSLYGLVGYLSDVLSYSRLLALGLATGVIALVVNLIAMILKDMLPSVLGWLVAILILIGGHLFNIGINVLGAFIHSGRLQFVEFFPKFMEGGGPRFKPLKRESKYVEVIK